nr:uncharacterized protein LOC109169920 [Ipomoea batatas]GMD93816.1 uncharacterized protein LOC109169920 [Ipomoea batatas]GME20123.1 uncharacterized protein LOC109169920 [Ipomoea batatas]
MFHSSDVNDRPVLPPYYYYVSNSKEMINGTALIPSFGSGNLAPPPGQFRHLSGSGPGLGRPCLQLSQSLPPNCLPPLLPLPISKPQSGFLSGPLTTTNTKTTRSDPRKTKSKKKPCRNPGKEQTLKSDNTKVLSPRRGQVVMIKVSSTSNPPPKHQLPSNKVSGHNVNVSTTRDGCAKEIDEQYDKFSGGRDRAVFTLSPPPSSLPLPTFSLRPKLRRSAPAAGNPEQRN